MHLKLTRWINLLLLGVAVRAGAQVTGVSASTSEPARDLAVSPAKFGPALLHGLSGSITFAGVHDSYLGWYNVAVGEVGFRFSNRYSVDATAAIYPYRLAPDETTTSSTTTTQLVTTHGDFSDTTLAFRTMFYPPHARDTITVSTALPSGNRPHGLGMGQETYDFSNYAERSFGRTTLLVETGIGDTSGLFNRLAQDDSNTLGPLAHFQAGVILWPLRRNYVQTAAYEQLPVGDQKIYTVSTGVTIPGQPPGSSHVVVSGRRVAEDNGITTTVGIPLGSSITLVSSYNRSFRLRLDTVSTGLTFVFSGPSRRRQSLVDRALIEAERLQ